MGNEDRGSEIIQKFLAFTNCYRPAMRKHGNRIRGILSTVPLSTVVISGVSNRDKIFPEEIAVCIRHDLNTAQSVPLMTAKGKGSLARRILETARKHRVPIIESPSFALSVYETVQAGSEMPEELYTSTAELLAQAMLLRQE